jgi:hypothetical protein
VSLRGHAADISLDLEDLKAAITDMVKRHQIRQKIKARYDHLDQSRYRDDIMGLKPAKLLRAAPKPEIATQRRPFSRSPRRQLSRLLGVATELRAELPCRGPREPTRS